MNMAHLSSMRDRRTDKLIDMVRTMSTDNRELPDTYRYRIHTLICMDRINRYHNDYDETWQYMCGALINARRLAAEYDRVTEEGTIYPKE